MKPYDDSIDYIGIVKRDTTFCDICEGMFPFGKILRADNYLNLCSNCSMHLESLPEPIKGIVTKFLIGNVL
jgi:hypothetical protein